MNAMDAVGRRRLLLMGAVQGGVIAFPGTATAVPNGDQDSKFVSLRDAHKGTLEIDLRIMNQFGDQPQDVQDFYVACRAALAGDDPANAVAKVCRDFKRHKLGGPLLGDVTSTGVSVWMHLPEPSAVTVTLTPKNVTGVKKFEAGGDHRIFTIGCDNLTPNTTYTYTVTRVDGVALGEGQFTTLPETLAEEPFAISFGADFHKIGMYRPELLRLVRDRGSHAMLLIGDSAVDGRKDNVAMIETDYLLRNLSPEIQALTANVPTSATWDDHDYWGDDTSGDQTRSGKPIDAKKLRRIWKTQWNNPDRDREERPGIYFATHFGPIHYIALDTRSCRVHRRKGQSGCFLGDEQMRWLKQQLHDSTSAFILISGGTMWTDNISAGKDSWGVWDPGGREQVFRWIDQKSNARVLLLSGDRHGARGFRIDRPGHPPIHEFEVGTLGGVPGPDPFGKDRSNQLFGIPSRSWAFGELSFRLDNGTPQATFRLIDTEGTVLTEHTINGSPQR